MALYFGLLLIIIAVLILVVNVAVIIVPMISKMKIIIIMAKGMILSVMGIFIINTFLLITISAIISIITFNYCFYYHNLRLKMLHAFRFLLLNIFAGLCYY